MGLHYIVGVCLLIFGGVCVSGDCNLSEVQECVGTATDLVTSLYFSPLNLEVLSDIKQKYCHVSLSPCLEKSSGNCTKTILSPYQTVVNTISYVCQKDFDIDSSCLKTYKLQHATAFCFQMFKVVFDNTLSDVTLSKSQMNAKMCMAFEDVSECVARAAVENCNFHEQIYIAEYLNAATYSVRDTLECTV